MGRVGSAIDANGHTLPATLALQDHRILLRISDRNARYPVRIDPFIQQGNKLTASDETGGGFRTVQPAGW